MTRATITVKIRVSWWVRPYLTGVALCAWLTGAAPNIEKVKRTAMRGIRFSL